MILQIYLPLQVIANSSPSQMGFETVTTDEIKNEQMCVGDTSAHDLSSSDVVLASSVKSGEGYLSMTKPSITDSGGYVEMQPSLLTTYAQPKSSASCVAASPAYAVGESSSNNSDLEQSVKDLKLLSPDRTNSPQQSPEPASDHSVGRGSMENLFELDEPEVVEGEKHKRKKKIKKRIRKFFTRHRSVEIPPKSGKRGSGTNSPTSSFPSSSSSIRKVRSLTHVDHQKVTVLDDNNTERELSPPSPSAQPEDQAKPRSSSENDILDTGFPVKRSYTMLTDHITKKYQRKNLRPDTAVTPSGISMNDNSTLSPVRELPREEDEKDATLVRSGSKDLTPPSKMSPPRYRRSLYCDQLKYKLRAALQNIHTPLSLSPIYHQLCVDDDAKCDSRYQLILLIQHALQRSRWRHDVMEIALLAELLKMIEPLPNEL